MPSGVYERKPYMKNMKHEQTTRIEKMLDIGMTRREICRALKVGESVVGAIIHRRNKTKIQMLKDMYEGATD